MGAKHTALSIEINLNNKGLKDIPHDKKIGDFIRLRKIDMAKNALTTIPYSICKSLQDRPKIVDTLLTLDLSNNRLTSVPAEICVLLNLKTLKLDNNFLTELPLHFHALYKLEKLSLHHNTLATIPPNFINLKKLRVLRLDHNQLKYIPNDIGELTTLKELTIHDNPLPQQLLDLVDLESVLGFFKSQQIPSEYKKALKELKKKAPKVENADDIKGEKIAVFKLLLADPKGRNLFKTHLDKEFASENLMFYLKVEEFRNIYKSDTEITTSALVEQANKIFVQFLDERESKQPINLPDEVARKITKIFTDTYKYPAGVNQWVFNEAQLSILKLMFTDTLKRFIATEEGKAVWSEFEQIWSANNAEK